MEFNPGASTSRGALGRDVARFPRETETDSILFAAQAGERVHRRGPPRGNVARHERDASEEHDDRRER